MAYTKYTRNAVETVGTSNVQVSSHQIGAQREVIVLRNISTGGQVISIAIGQEATANSGIVLNPKDSFVLSKDGAYNPSNLPVNAISDGASGSLTVYEEISENGS